MRSKSLDLLLIAIGAAFIAMNALGGAYDFQSDHRLFPLFLFADGKTVYSDPGVGPISPSLYPPLSFLAYFPALLFRTPGAAILSAKVLAQCFTVAPLLGLLWLRRERSLVERQRTLLLMLAAVLAISASNTLSQLTILHADAPALFLCFCGCLFIERLLRTSKSSWLLATALCCALAPWAKQPAAPIVLVPVVLLLMVRRWKLAAGFTGVYAVFQMILAGLFYLLFRGQWMFFWLFDVPSHHLLNGYQGITVMGTLSRVDPFVWILLAVALYYFVGSVSRYSRNAKISEMRLEEIFLLASLVEFVPSILGFLFPGGSNNALLYFSYPAFTFVLLRLQTEVLPLLSITQERWAMSAIVVASVGLSWPAFRTVEANWSLRYGFNVDTAYRFMRQHPGQVWFPRYPLTSYLAEGKVYHSEMGFLNAQLLGYPISPSRLLAHMPNAGRLIACAADCPYLQVSKQGYVQIPFPELSGPWIVYERVNDGEMTVRPLDPRN